MQDVYAAEASSFLVKIFWLWLRYISFWFKDCISNSKRLAADPFGNWLYRAITHLPRLERNGLQAAEYTSWASTSNPTVLVSSHYANIKDLGLNDSMISISISACLSTINMILNTYLCWWSYTLHQLATMWRYEYLLEETREICEKSLVLLNNILNRASTCEAI